MSEWIKEGWRSIGTLFKRNTFSLKDFRLFFATLCLHGSLEEDYVLQKLNTQNAAVIRAGKLSFFSQEVAALVQGKQSPEWLLACCDKFHRILI